jgi:hypothetical protein
MSGGHFNYKQYDIGYIADEVEQIIIDNDSTEKDEYVDIKGYHFTPEIINEFKKGLKILRQAQVYAQRIDWLVSSDDGPDSFLKRLKSDLEQLENT